jgi:hypothetical protein
MELSSEAKKELANYYKEYRKQNSDKIKEIQKKIPDYIDSISEEWEINKDTDCITLITTSFELEVLLEDCGFHKRFTYNEEFPEKLFPISELTEGLYEKEFVLPDSDILIVDDVLKNGEELMAAHDLMQNFSPSSVSFFTIMQVAELKDKAKEVMGNAYKNVHVLF